MMNNDQDSGTPPTPNDAVFQNHMTSLTVAEPSQFTLALAGTMMIAFWLGPRKRCCG
jgi:hypothetical protein